MSRVETLAQIAADNPIQLDDIDMDPKDMRFYSTYEPGKKNNRSNHDTYMPHSLPKDFQDFFLEYIKKNDLEVLDPEDRTYFSHYISRKTGSGEISRNMNVPYEDFKLAIRRSVEVLYDNSPKNLKDKFVLEELQKPKEATRMRAPNSIFSSGFSQKPLNIAEIERSRQESKTEVENEKERLKGLIAKARDLDPDEREAYPDIGAKFNWALGKKELPEDLKQFYRDHPDLEVDNTIWQDVNSRIWGGPYITFRNGEFYSVDEDVLIPLSDFWIKQHYNGNGIGSFRQAIIQFGIVTFDEIRSDIEATAVRAGYEPISQDSE